MTGSGHDVELVVDAHDVVGESPVWDERRGVLLWVDIPGRVLHRYEPHGGRHEVGDLGAVVGALVLRPDGSALAAVADGFAELDLDTGQVTGIATVTEAVPSRMNDGKCDPAGRFWAGTMSHALTPGAAALYRLDTDGSVATVLTGVTLSNGLDWSPDGTTMYYIDTMSHGVDAFDFDVGTGALSNRRRLVDVAEDDGLPDGMTVDAEGFLWVALYLGGAVRRYAPDGSLDAVLRMPVATPTCPVFGGEDLTDLYVTSSAMVMDEPSAEPGAGGLFRCATGVKGRPANRAGTPSAVTTRRSIP